MKLVPYKIFAMAGSLFLMVSGFLRFTQFGSPKELIISILYFFANLFIFCL